MDKGFKKGKIPIDFSDYTSPIAVEIARKQEEDLEKALYTVLETYNITVDKDELLKALSYDRNQYEAGYKAGYEAAMNEAIDYRTLFDWYISSVGDEEPVWTEQHIDELFRDYILIPKNANMSGGDADGYQV